MGGGEAFNLDIHMDLLWATVGPLRRHVFGSQLDCHLWNLIYVDAVPVVLGKDRPTKRPAQKALSASETAESKNGALPGDLHGPNTA